MSQDMYDVVKIKNITKYDFPNIVVDNSAFRNPRSPGNTAKPLFQRPDVPVLMWDGKVYGLAAGEIKEFPRFLAAHFAKHIAKRAVFEGGYSENRLRDKTLYEDFVKQIYVQEPALIEEKEETPVEKEDLTANVETLSMPELRKLASEKGVKFDSKTKKVELIARLNE